MSDKYDPDELISLPEGTEFESGLKRLGDGPARRIRRDPYDDSRVLLRVRMVACP